jgi:hypothetical protein
LSLVTIPGGLDSALATAGTNTRAADAIETTNVMLASGRTCTGTSSEVRRMSSLAMLRNAVLSER